MAERILLDGRSGSGKTELAAGLLAAWPEAQLVRLDDLYPGWDGLDAGSAAVPDILRTARWREWNWAEGAPGALHRLDAGRPLIVEGAGALSRASRQLADTAIWVETDDVLRKQRALLRDGDVYAPHWDRWAEQERRFIGREHPRELADLVVDGTTSASALRAVLRYLGR